MVYHTYTRTLTYWNKTKLETLVTRRSVFVWRWIAIISRSQLYSRIQVVIFFDINTEWCFVF